MMTALALAAFFPTAGHAAAWGVLIAGVLEALLVGGDVTWRAGVLPRVRAGRGSTKSSSASSRRFGPATSARPALQIALFADTIIASFLATGALSALYYADRLNQLADRRDRHRGRHRAAAGDGAAASRPATRPARATRRTAPIELTLLLSIPCLVAFLLVPELIMRALFMRGAFTAADAHAAAATLAAYAIGLLPFVLIRSVTVTFLARGDTADAGQGAARSRLRSMSRSRSR